MERALQTRRLSEPRANAQRPESPCGRQETLTEARGARTGVEDEAAAQPRKLRTIEKPKSSLPGEPDPQQREMKRGPSEAT